MSVKLSTGKEMPIEMHKARMVQKIRIAPVERRLEAMEEAGYNTFLLKTKDIFLDMLTDSGTNAMSDNQFAGRAAEHLITKVLAKQGDVIPTNYHFTTTKAHIELAGAQCLEIYTDEALRTQSTFPFKGNMDPEKLRDAIRKCGRERIPYVRMEATTNLLGGQPFSLKNLKEVRRICSEHGVPLVVDGSLICENAYLVRQREKEYENRTVAEIVREICSQADLFYMSGRKNTSVRGGCIATNNKQLFEKIQPWLPVYEGFFTYGGMSQREIGAMAVGMREMVDPDVAGCSIEQIKYFVSRLAEAGIPVVTPPGVWPVTWMPPSFCPMFPNRSTQRELLLPPSTWRQGSEVWKGEPSQRIETKMGERSSQIWNSQESPCQGESTQYRTWSMRSTG